MKLKNVLKIILLLISMNSFGQPNKQPHKDSSSEIHINVNYNNPKIYLLGGIASVITKEDLLFSEKYGVNFQDFGCLAPINLSDYETLNQVTFEKLNIIYGTKWQSEIRKDALGFNKWLENKIKKQ